MLTPATIQRIRIALLAVALLGVNAGGVLMTRAQDPNTATQKLSPKESAKTLTSGKYSRESLEGFFRKNAPDVLAKSGLQSDGVDTEKIAAIVSGSIGYEELTGSATQIVGKVQGLIENVRVANVASARASVAAFEADLLNKKTKEISDKLHDLANLKNKINDIRKKIIGLQDKASSYLNALPVT